MHRFCRSILSALLLASIASQSSGAPVVVTSEQIPQGMQVVEVPDETVEQLQQQPEPLQPEPLWQESIGSERPCENCGPTQFPSEGYWSWQLLPDGLIYKSYLAGVKESRISGVWAHDARLGWFLDVTLGGRVGILRYGSHDNLHPQGWQVDIEGAAFPRINLTENWDLDSADFRFGVPITYGIGRYQMKIAGYHLSSHVGDEYLVRNPNYQRINFSRDVLVWGHSYYPTDNLRVYGEVGYAVREDGGSKPWEFQFGGEFSPGYPTGIQGAPFAAVNAHLREEVDFGGEFVAQAGWSWRGRRTRHLFRTGVQYLTGKSNQYQFFRRNEDQIGFGLWYDY